MCNKYEIVKEIQRLTQAEDCLLVQNRANFEMIIKSLRQYKQNSIEEFERDWTKFEKDLYKYETKRNEFKDWAMQKSKFGDVFWLNLKTLQESVQHPGQEYFRINLKSMRKHAEAHLKQNILESLEQKEIILVSEERLKRFTSIQQVKIMRIKYFLSKCSKSLLKAGKFNK